MFGKLPEIFHKNFAIAYFLPVTCFISLSLLIINSFGYDEVISFFEQLEQTGLIFGTTLIILISWFTSIILLGVNRELIRFLEGYGVLNPLKLFRWFELRKFDKTQQKIRELDQQYIQFQEAGETIPDEFKEKRGKTIRDFKQRFPSERRHILPMPFGNTIRAFEIYSREMYGIDAIPGWSRLYAVIPKEYVEYIDNAKVFVDFWVNSYFLSWLFLIEFIILLIITGISGLWHIPILMIVPILICLERAKKSAVLWGDTVKSAFDVFLPDLWESIGFSIPSEKEDKKDIWKKFNQAVIYGRPDIMPDRKEMGKK